MSRRAFKMQLYPGYQEEYRRRHELLWPELRELLTNSGISEYSIFLDENTNELFGVMQVDDPALVDKLPEHPVMKKWWTYMRDLMETNTDDSPVSIELTEVFYLP